jgi:hypothetical protein
MASFMMGNAKHPQSSGINDGGVDDYVAVVAVVVFVEV